MDLIRWMSRSPESKPLASCTNGTTAILAAKSAAVLAACSNKALVAGNAPYSEPNSLNLSSTILKCLASSAATLRKSS